MYPISAEKDNVLQFWGQKLHGLVKETAYKVATIKVVLLLFIQGVQRANN